MLQLLLLSTRLKMHLIYELVLWSGTLLLLSWLTGWLCWLCLLLSMPLPGHCLWLGMFRRLLWLLLLL
jgi:hypothetical protein